MDKKKVIAVVTFIVLGLFIFTFANPNDELEPTEIDGNNVVNPDNEENNNLTNQDNTKENNNLTNQDNTNENNNLDNQDNTNENNNLDTQDNTNENNNLDNQDNTYENNNLDNQEDNNKLYNEALDALIKAEETLNKEDYDKATDLVSKLEDKKELDKRIDNLNNVFNLDKLLNELVNKTNESKSKLELDEARKFNETNDILNQLNNLIEDKNKNNLLNKYNEISPKLLDNKAPIIEGLDKYYNNNNLNLIISDESSFQAKLNNENYISGTDIKDGIYNIKAIDASFNEVSKDFIIDTVNPKFNINDNTIFFGPIHVKVVDDNLDYILVYDQDNLVETIKTNEFVLKKLAGYRLEAYDKAGNKTVLKRVILEDNAPLFKGKGFINNKEVKLENNGVYQKILFEFRHEFLTNVKINDKLYTNKSFELDKVTNQLYFRRTIKKDIYEDGIYNIEANDDSLNKFSIKVILDNTKPVFNIIDSKHYENKVDVKVTDDNFDYVLVTNYKTNQITKESSSFTLTDEATYYIEAYDKAGNISPTWIAIDNTNPLITDLDNNILEDNIITNNLKLKVYDKYLTEIKVISDKEVIYNRNDFNKKPNNEDFSKELEFNQDGNYTLIAKDKFGHETKINFTIDTIKPRLSAANILKSGEKNEQREYYTKVGDKVNFYISMYDELRDIPTFKLINHDNVVVINKEDIKVRKNKDNKYIYSTTYQIKETDNFKDGLIEMNVSNIYDKAGNKANDITKPTNGHIVHFDNTLPMPKYLFIYNLNNKENRKNIVNGEYLRIMIHFNEEVLLPKLIIGNQTIDFKKCSYNQSNNYSCFIDYKLTNDLNLKSNEEVKFKVIVKDKSLNEVILNNDNITSNKTYGNLIYRETFKASSVYALKDNINIPTLDQRLSASNFKEVIELKGLTLIDDDLNTLNNMILKSQEIKDYEVGMNIDNTSLKKYLTVESQRKINLNNYNFYALKYNKLEKKWHLDCQKIK